MTKEIRQIETELRVDEASPQQIGGYAIVYDSPSLDLGGFTEIIKPGAITDSLASSDVLILFNHNDENLLGRTSSETLTLTDDDHGLSFLHELPDTSCGRDCRFHIGKKNLTKMSFGFVVRQQSWRDTPTGLVREILKLDLHEISIVANPAYEATSVDFRSYHEYLDSVKPVEAVRNWSNDYLMKIIVLAS